MSWHGYGRISNALRSNFDVMVYDLPLHDELFILHNLNPIAIRVGDMEVGAAPICM